MKKVTLLNSMHYCLDGGVHYRFEFVCHVHQATERYLAAGKKDEGFASPTQDYKTLSGALHSLVKRCNISGLSTQPEEPDLFE